MGVLFEKAISKILDGFEQWVSEGSGWVMNRINSITLKIARYHPIKGKSYIKTPKKIEGKHAIINIQNEDDKCFLYSIVAALHPAVNHTQSVYSYAKKLEELTSTKQLIYDPKDMPMPVSRINKFEKENNLTLVTYISFF